MAESEYTRFLPLTEAEAAALDRLLLAGYDYKVRTLEEAEGLTRSDAQAAVDADTADLTHVRERLAGTSEELSLTDAAAELGVSRQTVANWITGGLMEAYRRGPTSRSAYVIPRSEVERMRGPHAKAST